MKRARCLLTLALVITASTVAPGGCPLTPTQLEPLPPTPGTYWIEEQNRTIYYFQFPRGSESNGSWLPLGNVGDWYVGPGFYSLTEDFAWSPEESLAGQTLDDAIQLYDPPPEVPESSF